MGNIHKLAVIIPCWNCEKDINGMLDSILQQSYQDWDVFCIDDQSTDNTLCVLQKYSCKDNRIHYYVRNREPKGAQTCRNIGLELSNNAEYIIWLDADDLVAPYCFEQRIAYLDKHPYLDFAIFPAKSFSKELWEQSGTIFFGYPFCDDSLKAMLSWTLPMVGWTNIYRYSSLIKFEHKWDERLLSLQDSDFNLQSIIKGLKYDFAYKEGAKIDYFWRVNNSNNSLTNKIKTRNHFESHLYLFSKTISSMSPQLEEKYLDYIKVNSLMFANLFKTDNNYFCSFLNHPWLRRHKALRFRYQLWRLFHFHFGQRLFFLKIYNTKKYMDHMKNNFTSKINLKSEFI